MSYFPPESVLFVSKDFQHSSCWAVLDCFHLRITVLNCKHCVAQDWVCLGPICDSGPDKYSIYAWMSCNERKNVRQCKGYFGAANKETLNISYLLEIFIIFPDTNILLSAATVTKLFRYFNWIFMPTNEILRGTLIITKLLF